MNTIDLACDFLNGTFGACTYQTPKYVCAGDGFIADLTLRDSGIWLTAQRWFDAVNNALPALRSHPNFNNVSYNITNTSGIIIAEAKLRVTGVSAIDRASEDDIISDIVQTLQASVPTLTLYASSISISRRGTQPAPYKSTPPPPGGQQPSNNKDGSDDLSKTVNKYLPYAVIGLLGVVLIKAID